MQSYLQQQQQQQDEHIARLPWLLHPQYKVAGRLR
jgi:hypothetical protein